MKINDLLVDFEDYINNYKDIKSFKNSYFDKLLKQIVDLMSKYKYYIDPSHEDILLEYINNFVANNSEQHILDTIKTISNIKMNITDDYTKMPDILNTHDITPCVNKMYINKFNSINSDLYTNKILKKHYEQLNNSINISFMFSNTSSNEFDKFCQEVVSRFPMPNGIDEDGKPRFYFKPLT